MAKLRYIEKTLIEAQTDYWVEYMGEWTKPAVPKWRAFELAQELAAKHQVPACVHNPSGHVADMFPDGSWVESREHVDSVADAKSKGLWVMTGVDDEED